MQLSQTDLDFIWAQLRLPGNRPATALDSTGIRDVQGIGNNIANPTWGAAGTLFPRATFADYSYANRTGGFTLTRDGVAYDPNLSTDYATRGTTVVDASPRIISNLIANQDGLTPLQVADRPEDSPGGRVSPVTGGINPMPYSSFTTLFGQFFDHGLDFVHKGQDGMVFIPLLPGDSLYDPLSPTNFMLAPRTNTASVALGEGSTDQLVADLGLDGLSTRSWDPVTGSTALTGPYTGTLVVNGRVIQVADAAPADVVAAINAATAMTGVIASLDDAGMLVLTPVAGESFNTISSPVDLSQSYGSTPSHLAFLREYDAQGEVTGRLVSGGADKDGNLTPDGMATWADIKANAALIGITLRDRDVLDIPTVRLNDDGTPWRDETGQARLVALDRVTGEIVYVQDSSPAALAIASPNGAVLVTTGAAFLDDIAHGLIPDTAEGWTADGDLADPAAAELLAAHFVAGDGRANENIGLTAIHEVFHSEHNRTLEEIKTFLTHDPVTNTYTDVHGNVWSTEDLFQAAKLSSEMQYQHLVFGEFVRKLSPNIDGFAGYDVTLDPSVTAEFAHAVYRFGHSMLTETVSLTGYDADGRAIANPTVELAADAISTTLGSADVMLTIAGHGLVTGNYVTLAGIEAAVGGIPASQLNGTFKVVAVDADTVSITVARPADATETGTVDDAIAVTLDARSLGLIEAFLNPLAYTSTTAGEVALGMGAQVGNAIDEWMTPALRDNLVGLPLDLAALNLARGRDSGVPTLNEVRQSLFDQTGLTSLAPYGSWDEFAMALLHPESLTNFIMAYARDAILARYGDLDPTTPEREVPADWNALQLEDPVGYAEVLRLSAELAISDPVFMSATGNQNFRDIDLWIGGLAESKVAGGMLGSTFDFLFARQMIALQNGDRFYYLERLGGTNLLDQIEGQLFADIVMRNTGVKHLYPDIFTVADEAIELVDPQASAATMIALQRQTLQVTDAEGFVRTIGQAGFVGATFYGNPGSYLDARGVYNPNGAGNESEIIGGTAFADSINGLGGNDALYGDEGNDTLEGGRGNDFVRGGVGDDVLTDSDGDDFLWGDDGNDWVNGGIGIDAVFGGAGDDTVYGGAGADEVSGGFGNDVVYGDNGAVGPNGTLDPTGGDDVLLGGDGDDTLFGGGGADRLSGDAGNDVLYGGAGADRLEGMDGDDLFVMDAGDLGFDEVIDGGLGFDVVDYSASAGNGLGANGERLGINIDLSNLGLAAPPLGIAPPDAFTSIEGALGSVWNDTLVGGDADVVDGLGEPVLVLDANGNPLQAIDPLTGLPEFDLTGAPVFITELMAFMLDGQAGNDLIVGGSRADTLFGGEGRDSIHGALGDDIVVAGAGDDLVYGDDAPDGLGVIALLGGADLIDAGEGNDTVMGGGGDDSIIGGAGDDLLLGNVGDDTLEGGEGNDTLQGGLGNDVLVGGIGVDTLQGDEGDDRFVVDALGEADALIDGGLGFDVVDFSGTQAGVVFGFGVGLGAGVPAANPFVNVEGVIGTDFGDTLVADALAGSLLVGGAGDDLLQGGAGSDTLDGGEGNDTLRGDAGSDVLRGGAGVDTLLGEDGDDRILVDALGETDALVDGGAGFDLIDFSDTQAGVTFGLGVGLGTVAPVADAFLNFEGVIGTAFDDTLTADALSASRLVGEAGNDLLQGGAGADTLEGGAGEDLLHGGDGADELEGGSGADTLEGDAGDDTLDGGEGNDTLQGGLGNDVLIGGAGVDTLLGEDGDDRIVVDALGEIDALVDGGAGFDLIDFSATQSGVIYGLGVGLGTVAPVADAFLNFEGVIGTDFDDVLSGDALLASRLEGGDGNDLLRAGAGGDTLLGGDGADTLVAGGGTDRLEGGAGNDVYEVGGMAAAVEESADGGWDVTIASDSVYAYDNVEEVQLTGSAYFAVGNASGNRLVGNDAENLLIGFDGNDTLLGGGARDGLFGVEGDDSIDGGAGIDYIVAGNGNDTVTGGADADEIYGEAGDDLLYGGDDFATDILVGGDGNDTLDGGQAWDLMYGGLGDDTFYASQQVDWVFEGVDEGYDTVIADSGNGYYLYDNVEVLILRGDTPFGVGNALANTIIGSDVTNVLLGGEGNDTLNGGAGDDVLWGEGGSDTFVLGLGTGRDVIGDFDVSADVVDLSAFGLLEVADVGSRITQFGSDVLLDLGNGDQLALIGVQMESLTSANFVL
jgi:Ca2+-binding RTX toxin-like protein